MARGGGGWGPARRGGAHPRPLVPDGRERAAERRPVLQVEASAYPLTEPRRQGELWPWGPVTARSLISVTTLGVEPGHEIRVRATGAEARQAIEEIGALAAGNFGDDPA